MLVRIKPCYRFASGSMFDNWAKKYIISSFHVDLSERNGEKRYYPPDVDFYWQFFREKELIFIKEKK